MPNTSQIFFVVSQPYVYHVPSFWMDKGRVATSWVGSQVNKPHARVMTPGKVEGCYLQVIAIDVALVERDAAIGCYLLVCAAAHAVIGALNNRAAVFICE